MPFLAVGLPTHVIGNRQCITLSTDFGTQDYFVGAMKGVILGINPAAGIVDITHDIPPQDIHAGAFNLLATYRDFSPGTIHVAVVDPGVGSRRRPLLIACAERYFVGPDNGLFGWICERESSFIARHLTNETFWRRPTSHTFHGRDIFAPVAAAISTGVDPVEFGPVVHDIVRLESLRPTRTQEGLAGNIIHIDRFGNCITNFIAADVGFAPTLSVNDHRVTAFRKFFSDDEATSPGELFMIEGSAGFIEVVVRNGSAADILKPRRGQPVLLFSDPDHGESGS